MNKIKICGLFRPIDIDYVNLAKPNYAGFIIDFPKSYRSIDFDTANSLIPKLSEDISPVCVFVDADINHIFKFKDTCKIIQLHGSEDNNYIESLKGLMPEAEIWKAFKISTEKDIELSMNSNAHKIVLDNGYGTGSQFDWSLISGFNREFILAGGLNKENILAAIKEFKPYALDVSSGVETNKLKDYEKISDIVNIVRSED